MTDQHKAQAEAERLIEESSLGRRGVRIMGARTPPAVLERIARLTSAEALLLGELETCAVAAATQPPWKVQLERLLREVELYDGAVVDEGRGRLVARFDDVRDAFAAAVRAVGPSLRLAVHTYAFRDHGTTEPPQFALDEVAALGKAGYGGQVLASLSARRVVAGDLPREASLREVGRWWTVGDRGEPPPVFGLLHPSLPGTFPSLRSDAARPGELPEYGRSLRGRDIQLRSLAGRLQPGRFVTLVGGSGIGKTRLAVEVARRAAPSDFPDGVRFCDATTVRDATELVERVAASFERPLVAGHQWIEVASPWDRASDRRREITGSLQGRLLLVIDGCDHVHDEVRKLIGELLEDGEATVLATSVRPLGVPDEVVVPVGPLEVHGAGGEGVAPAIELIAELLAELEDPDGPGGPDEASLVDVVRGAGGVPLVLELVAPLLRRIESGELAARLAEWRSPDPEADRTLVTALDLAVGSLPAADARLFAALSTFPGGWDLSGAEAVAVVVGVDPAEVASAMTLLTRHSLVRVDVPVEGRSIPVRYRMLDAVRAYASERLTESGRRLQVADAHATFVLDLTRAGREARRTAFEPAWVRAIGAEHDNVRAAYTWFAAQGRHGDALELVWNLADDVLMRERHDVGRWAEALGTDPATEGHPLRPAALALASNTALVAGEQERAERLAQAALAEGADRSVVGRWIALNTLALVAAGEQDEDRCREIMMEAVQVAQATQDVLAICSLLYEAVLLLWLSGQPAEGQHYAVALDNYVDDDASPSIQAMAALAKGLTEAGESATAAHQHLERGMDLALSACNPLLFLHGWRAAHRLVLSPKDRLPAVRHLWEVAEEFRVRGNVNEQVQTVVDLVWHLLGMGVDQPAAVICGYVGATRYRYMDRYRLAERRLREGWSPSLADAWEEGAAMTAKDFAEFVKGAVERLGELEDEG